MSREHIFKVPVGFVFILGLPARMCDMDGLALYLTCKQDGGGVGTEKKTSTSSTIGSRLITYDRADCPSSRVSSPQSEKKFSFERLKWTVKGTTHTPTVQGEPTMGR